MMEDHTVPASVRTVYVLDSGELIYSREDYEKIRERFAWVDQHFVLSELLRLRRLTDNGKQSLIAIYETGRVIKPFLNIDHNFHQADLVSPSRVAE
ncbi:MAG: hypothetical protein H7Y42_11635 [Chitinophagaceae bacterium]|nr:hypothetical protein [Chitinophagaceae bacterium]